jgi:hypothetical protein
VYPLEAKVINFFLSCGFAWSAAVVYVQNVEFAGQVQQF